MHRSLFCVYIPSKGRSAFRDTASMSFFLELEKLYAQLEEWQVCKDTSKDDVIRQCRLTTGKLISYLLATPQVGSAFCSPSDTLRVAVLQSEIEKNHIVFESDAPPQALTCVDNDAATESGHL